MCSLLTCIGAGPVKTRESRHQEGKEAVRAIGRERAAAAAAAGPSSEFDLATLVDRISRAVPRDPSLFRSKHQRTDSAMSGVKQTGPSARSRPSSVRSQHSQHCQRSGASPGLGRLTLSPQDPLSPRGPVPFRGPFAPTHLEGLHRREREARARPVVAAEDDDDEESEFEGFPDDTEDLSGPGEKGKGRRL